MNKVIESYIYISLGEFFFNNILHASIQQVLFYANYGYHSKLHLLCTLKNKNPIVEDLEKQLPQLQTTLKLHLQAAQDSYKVSSNEFRKEFSTYQVGDNVWLL